MKAEVINVGTELLLGQITNSNSRELAKILVAEGIFLYYQSTVGDNESRLKETFENALNRSEIILFSGGLGPTSDDITRETVASVLNRPLEINKDWEEHLKHFFQSIGRPYFEVNQRQAMVPWGGKLLPNKNGTAPGLYIEEGGRHIFLLPGPPRELIPLFHEQVLPLLKQVMKNKGLQREFLLSDTLRICGIGEGEVEERLKALISNQDNPTIAPLAKGFEVHLRLTARASSKEEGRLLLDEEKAKIYNVLGDYIYGENDENLELIVARLFWEKKLTLSLAESCTGGLIANRLTDIAGSSDFLHAALVTYSNEAKVKFLNVSEELLAKYGAVSQEVALAMAEGARKVCKTDIGLAVTGIAGPGGATPGKPVGLVYLALAGREKSIVKKYQFWGERRLIKQRTSQTGLYLLRKFINEGSC